MEELSMLEVMSLEGNIADNWRCWKQCFEIFSLASKLSNKDTNIQISSTWQEPKHLGFTNKTKKFDRYCNPRNNVTYKFNTQNQLVGETIDQ